MSGYEKLFRAGIIPFTVNYFDGSIRYMFMKPSHPDFGGPDWQIAKGRVENDDDNLTTAIREGQEELGLREDNIIDITELGMFLGRTVVFLAHVKNETDFDQFHWETGDVAWLSLEEFKQTGRKLHLPVLEEAELNIRLTVLSDID